MISDIPGFAVLLHSRSMHYMALCTSITRYLPFSGMAKDVYQFHSKGIEPIVNQMLILFV